MIKKSLLILFLLILSSRSVYAEEYTAEEIIENLYMAKISGKIQDMIIDLEAYGPSLTGQEAKGLMELFFSARLFFALPNKIRTEKTIPAPDAASMMVVTIRDGTMDWAFTSYDKNPVSKKADDHHHSLLLPFNIDNQPQDAFRIYTLVAIETLDDRETFVLSISNEEDPEARLLTVWVDRERFIPLKEEYYLTQGEREIKKTTLYKDVGQLIDGRWMPYRIERYENDKMTLYITYKDILVNQGLDYDLFNPDEYLPLPED